MRCSRPSLYLVGELLLKSIELLRKYHEPFSCQTHDASATTRQALWATITRSVHARVAGMQIRCQFDCLGTVVRQSSEVFVGIVKTTADA